MKNKIKIFSLMLTFGFCFNFALNSAKVSAEKSLKTQINENQIKGYELEQIVKNGNFSCLVYKHKKSGALALVHNFSTYSFSGIYFSNLKKNNLTAAYGLKNLLKNALKKNLNEFFKLIKIFNSKKGSEFKIDVDFKNKNIVKILTKELKNPSFLKNNKISEETKKQVELKLNYIINSLKNIYNIEDNKVYEKLSDRFNGDVFLNNDVSSEVNKLSINSLKENFEKIFVPQNAMVVLNSTINKNYKEILETFSEEYFNLYQQKEEQISFKNNVEKNPFREIEVDNLKYSYFYNHKKHIKNAKFMSRIYWDVSSLPKSERYFLALTNYKFKDLMRNYLKKLGYFNLNYNEKENINGLLYDSIAFDGLIFMDLYGDDEKLFKKETLIKNSKKIFKEFIDKVEKSKEYIAKELNRVVFFNEYSKDSDKNTYSKFLLSIDPSYYIEKSFGLTKNPFSKKYFNIKPNKEIEDISADKNKFLKKFKNFKKNFNFFLENDPKYIDIFVVNKKTKNNKAEDEKTNFKFYKNPLQFPKIKNKNLFSKEAEVEILTKDLIYETFFETNLLKKGLVYKISDLNFNMPKSNKKEVENYLFGNFKKEFKNYKPKEKDFEFLKKQTIKEVKDYIKHIKENDIKYRKNLLKSKERVKKIAEYNKSIVNLTLKGLKADLFERKKDLKKFLKEEKTKENQEIIENVENNILKSEERIKELEKNKENLAFFEKQIEENNNKNIEWGFKQIENQEKLIKIINEIKIEDIVDLIKKIKFQDGSELEEM